jgi:hypothetical protein
MLGMFTALFNALRAPVETVQMIYDTLAEYWDRVAEIMEYSDEKEGAQARCLIGFSQVAVPSCAASALARVCTYL